MAPLDINPFTFVPLVSQSRLRMTSTFSIMFLNLVENKTRYHTRIELIVALKKATLFDLLGQQQS